MPTRHFAKLAFFVAATVGLSSTVIAETLKEAVEETIASNPDVIIASKNRLATTEVYYQARSNYYPSVDLNAGYGVQRSKNPSVSGRTGKNDYDSLTRYESGVFINQLIFDGFGTPAEVARQRSATRASAYNVASVAQDLGLDAVSAYINVLRTEELVSIAKANLSVHRRNYSMVKQRADSGLTREAELDQASGRLALAKANLKARQSQYRDAKIEYLRVIGKVPHDLRDKYIPHVSIPDTQEEVVALALANHPRMHQAQFLIEESEARYYVARSLFWPRVDAQFGGDWNRNIDGSRGVDNDYYAMLRMEYNVFNGGGDLAKVREARYLSQRAQEAYNLTARDVGESARKSWNDYRTALGRKNDLKEHRDFAKKTVIAYRQQFQLDKRSLLDLLDQENEYFNASSDYVDEQYNELFSRYRILNSTGMLLQRLEVPLPIEAFDDFERRYPRAGASDVLYPVPNVVTKADGADVMMGPVYTENEVPKGQFYAKNTQSAATTSANAAKATAVAKSSKRMTATQIAKIKRQQQKAAAEFAQARANKQISTPAEWTTTAAAEPAASANPDTTARTASAEPAIAANAATPDRQQPQAVASATAPRQDDRRDADARQQQTPNVQIATFSERENAQRLINKLRDKGYDAYINQAKQNGKQLSQVRVLPKQQDEDNHRAAEDTLAELEREFQIRGIITD